MHACRISTTSTHTYTYAHKQRAHTPGPGPGRLVQPCARKHQDAQRRQNVPRGVAPPVPGNLWGGGGRRRPRQQRQHMGACRINRSTGHAGTLQVKVRGRAAAVRGGAGTVVTGRPAVFGIRPSARPWLCPFPNSSPSSRCCTPRHTQQQAALRLRRQLRLSRAYSSLQVLKSQQQQTQRELERELQHLRSLDQQRTALCAARGVAISARAWQPRAVAVQQAGTHVVALEPAEVRLVACAALKFWGGGVGWCSRRVV